MNQPFRTIRNAGWVMISRTEDEAFRKALLDGVPTHLRSKMMEALAVRADKKSLEHSKRYFGAELQAIGDRCKPLVDELDHYMEHHRCLPGFRQWMITTGYANEYRMVKVLNAWALLASPMKHQGTTHIPGAITYV